jgi:hypothetical protein
VNARRENEALALYSHDSESLFCLKIDKAAAERLQTAILKRKEEYWSCAIVENKKVKKKTFITM